MKFIEEASMLHDIGIFKTYAPQIGCNGEYPYIYHGYLGGQILKNKGFERHALVCERHPGTGISAKAIKDNKLDLPAQDMIPVTIEEQIVSYADKFFSKDPESSHKEKTVEEILTTLSKYGTDQVINFKSWLKSFH